jgi:hypothetical protein
MEFDKAYYEGKVKEAEIRVQKEINATMQKIADLVVELSVRQQQNQKDREGYLKLIAENEEKGKAGEEAKKAEKPKPPKTPEVKK